MRWLVPVLVFLACSGQRPAPSAGPPPRRIELALPGVDGLSGLTRDGDGVLWAVPESARVLVRIELDGATTTLPLLGVDDGLDTESIAWLDGDRFALGTESMDARRSEDLVLVVEQDEHAARVVAQHPLSYAGLPVAPEENRGIEGLCHADGALLAALEPIGHDGGRRFAVVARGELGAQGWTPFRVWLTSATGKLAALSCVLDGERIVVHAVERHYDVLRILRLSVPREGGGGDVTPALARDLSHTLAGDPNLEGLFADASGFWLVADNHFARRTGPNELIHAPGR